MKKKIGCILAAGVLLSGCTTLDPYTGSKQVSKATTGAGVGALSGALLGQMIGKNTAGTLIGAGLGGLAGGMIGASRDKQDAELREVLMGSGVQIAREGDDIRLIMPGNITFEHNRAEIRADFYRTLNAVATVLRKYNDTVVRVVGYCSSVGDAMYNQRLSEQRASSVANYLVAQGVGSGRVVAQGMGARYPIASNKTSSGQELNRRVEITIQPVH